MSAWLFHPLLSKPTPSLEVLKVFIRILTEVNMQVTLFQISGFLGRELPTPQLAAAVMKGRQMQNEELRLRELFR